MSVVHWKCGAVGWPAAIWNVPAAVFSRTSGSLSVVTSFARVNVMTRMSDVALTELRRGSGAATSPALTASANRSASTSSGLAGADTPICSTGRSVAPSCWMVCAISWASRCCPAGVDGAYSPAPM